MATSTNVKSEPYLATSPSEIKSEPCLAISPSEIKSETSLPTLPSAIKSEPCLAISPSEIKSEPCLTPSPDVTSDSYPMPMSTSPSEIKSEPCLTPSPDVTSDSFPMPMSIDDAVANEPCLIPSKVRGREFVYAFEEERIVDRSFGGWWLVFSNIRNRNEEGLTDHDQLWFKIKDYVITGELFDASASTAAPSSYNANGGNGVICVYTKDYRDKDDVIKTAEKIRQCLGISFINTLYYKTDEARRARLYSAHGGEKISLYRHEWDDGSVHERVGEDRHWNLIYKPSLSPEFAQSVLQTLEDGPRAAPLYLLPSQVAPIPPLDEQGGLHR